MVDVEDISKRGYIKRVPYGSVMPENAVRLTEAAATKIQLDNIRNWKNQSEVWPFGLGHLLLGGAASVGGLYFNYHFRKQLTLRAVAQLSTYMPAFAIPGITAPIVHSIFVTSDVLIQKSHCPVCVQARASVLQVVAGVIYPLLLIPLATFHFADRNCTYVIPPMKDSYGVMKLWWKFTRLIFRPIGVLFIFQTLSAVYITQKEQEVIQKINQPKLYSEDEFQI